MRFFERPAGENVVEDHRNAEPADFNYLSGFAFQHIAQDKPSIVDAPDASNIERDIGGQRGREIGLRQNTS